MWLTALKYLPAVRAFVVAHRRVILAALVCWYCWHAYDAQKARADNAERALVTFKATVKAAEEKAAKDNAKREALATENNINTALAYNEANERLRKYYEKNPTVITRHVGFGVCLTPSGSGAVSAPETEGAAGGIDETAQGGEAGAGGVTPLDCASDVLQLLSLQKWEREQQAIYSSP